MRCGFGAADSLIIIPQQSNFVNIQNTRFFVENFVIKYTGEKKPSDRRKIIGILYKKHKYCRRCCRSEWAIFGCFDAKKIYKPSEEANNVKKIQKAIDMRTKMW